MLRIAVLLAVALCSAQAQAGFEISVFNPTGGTSTPRFFTAGPGQMIPIYLSHDGVGPTTFNSVTLQFQITPSSPTPPSFTSVAYATGPGSLDSTNPGGTPIPQNFGTSGQINIFWLNPTPQTFTPGVVKLADLVVDTSAYADQGPFTVELVRTVGTLSNPSSVDLSGAPAGGGPTTLSSGQFSMVPEPSVLWMAGLGMGVVMNFRRRRHSLATAA